MKSISSHYLKALLLAIPAVLIGLQLMYWVFVASSPNQIALCDFSHYYRIGRMLWSGKSAQLYDETPSIEQQIEKTGHGLIPFTTEMAWNLPFLHPAYEAPLFSTVSFLPMHWAYLAWLALNVLAMFGIYRMLLPHVPTLATLRPWVPFSLVFAFAYVPRAALFGQDSVVLLLVLCGAFSFVATNDLFSAGVILGLGSFRFQHTLVIVGLFLAWKAWNFVAGYLASGVACALASLAVTGIRGQIAYVELLHRASHWPIYYEMNNLRSVFIWLGLSDRYTPILLAGFLCLCAFFGRKMTRQRQFAFAVICVALGSYYLFFFDLAVLFLPVTLLLEDVVSCGRGRLAAVALLLFSAPVWVLFVVNVNQAQAMTFVVLVLFVFAVLWYRTRAPHAELETPYPQAQSNSVTVVTG